MEYQAKAFTGEMPPVLILSERKPGVFAVMLKAIAVGEKHKRVVEQFDKLCKTAYQKERIFNQLPIQTSGVVIQSGWEFTGSPNNNEDSKMLKFGREVSKELGVPLYYQNDQKDANYRLVLEELGNTQLQNL